MSGVSAWPVWPLVLLCGIGAQVVKLVLYSVARRRVLPAALFRGRGLPSLPAVVVSCLLVLTVLRRGWTSGEAAFAVVFAVIVVHDTVKLTGLADRQRLAVTEVLTRLEDPEDLPGPVAELLDPRAHHPAHVAAGVVLGVLFALAFGTAPR